MKKLLVLFVALALMSVSVIAAGPFGGSGWAACNPAGNYGGHAIDNCYVAWDGVTGHCDGSNRDATFTIGTTGLTTNKITIDHLNGISEIDGFQVMDGNKVLCEVPDVPTSTENWVMDSCDVDIDGVKTLTIHPTSNTPWDGCDTWGQVAVKGITFDTNTIPEFGVIAGGIALIGALGIFLYKRK